MDVRKVSGHSIQSSDPRPLQAFPPFLSLLLWNIRVCTHSVLCLSYKLKCQGGVMRPVTSNITVTREETQWLRLWKRREDTAKTIPPNTSWLGVLEDRLPASEDAVDGRTASTTGSVRKGFEFGMDSSTASAAEVKGSEVGRGGETGVQGQKGRSREITVERGGGGKLKREV